MNKNKLPLPQEIQLSCHVEEFLEKYAQAIRDGYVITPSFYSPQVTPRGLLMVTMHLTPAV